jgi:glycosyltransferase involved in cell wall biosynthesis
MTSSLSITEIFKPVPLTPLPERPLVSVLISNHNYEEFLPRAIESVIAQTYGNWEAIICDDGSTDGSRSLIERYAARDARIRHVFQLNGGQSSALNAAYYLSRGQVICLLDADDEFVAAKIERSVATFRQSLSAGYVIHPVIPISANGKVIGGKLPAVLANGWVADKVLRTGGEVIGLPPTSGLTFRREIAEELFPIPVRLLRCSDGYLNRTAPFVTQIASIGEPLALYRLHGKNSFGTIRRTPASVEHSLSDYWLTVGILVEFLRRRYGEAIANELDPRVSLSYREKVLAYYVLTGSMPQSALGEDPAQIINSLPTKSFRMAWRILLALPRRVSSFAFFIWQAKYPGKKLLRPLAMAARLTPRVRS